MEVETFLSNLKVLTISDIHAIATEIEGQAASAAGEVAWWHATVEIERLVRLHRSCREATIVGRRAAEAVSLAAKRYGVDAEESVVRTVARAAAEVARGMVAGDAEHVCVLLEAWPLTLAA